MGLFVQVFLVLALSCSAALAAELSPSGLWRTIDDRTGKPHGLVRITEVNGEFQGKLQKTLPQPAKILIRSATSAAARAEPAGDWHDYLMGLIKQGDGYQGGEVLDPENGKIYRANVRKSG